MRARIVPALVLLVASNPAAGALEAQVEADRVIRVGREAVLNAMLAEAEQEYNLRATTNSTRFSTSVILGIVRTAMADAPDGPPLLIHHSDWYEAYSEVTGLPPHEIPEFVALANEYGQDRVVDYRLADSRVDVVEGFEPELIVPGYGCPGPKRQGRPTSTPSSTR